MSKTNFMRENMVQCQLSPNNISDERIKESFLNTPKEVFLPENIKDSAYIDEDLQTDSYHFILEPMVQAKLFQAADIHPEDVVLDIGSNRGYSAALLSQLASTVIALENDQKMVIEAGEILSELGIANVAPVFTDLTQGYEKEAPYDVIVFEGAVSVIPPMIKNQLKVSGRLVCIYRDEAHNPGKAMLITRHETYFDQKVLFDASTPYIKGFEPKKSFSF